MSFRINGFGTTLLGVSKPDDDGNNSATLWITILYLPIVPLRRQIVRFVNTEDGELVYSIVSDESLRLKEVLRTMLFCWILVPLAAAVPAIPAFTSVWAWLGLPEKYLTAYTIGVVIYEIVLVVILQNLHERYMEPKETVAE